MPIKLTTSSGVRGKKKKNQKNLTNKSKHRNNKCFSWVTTVRVLSLAGRHSPPYLPRMPSNTVLISGTAVEAAHILMSGLVCFILWELSMPFYMFQRHRVCLVDHVGLICSLYSWWESFGSSSLATLPLGFNCGFISTSACGSSTGVLLLRLPWRVWVCPCEGQMQRWCSFLDPKGSGSTRCSGGLAARAAGNTVL